MKVDYSRFSWKGLHGKQVMYDVHNVFFSVSINGAPYTRKIKWAGHVECTGEKRNAYRILVEKLERNTLL
jgi:hypothetical protein